MSVDLALVAAAAAQAPPALAAQDVWPLPIHPAIVHFPVAMLSTAWALTVLGHVTGWSRGQALAGTVEWIGVAFLPLTILTGFRDADWLGFLADPQWDQPLIWHFMASTVAAVLFSAHAIWRHRVGTARASRPWVDLGLSSAGFWFVLVTGLIAGEMVFG